MPASRQTPGMKAPLAISSPYIAIRAAILYNEKQRLFFIVSPFAILAYLKVSCFAEHLSGETVYRRGWF